MIKKYKFIIYISFILLVGCGYNSVLNDNSSNFSIANIKVSGDSNINENILINLENYINNSEKEKKYFLKINNIENKNITSKDEKGDPKTHNIEITFDTFGKFDMKYMPHFFSSWVKFV